METWPRCARASDVREMCVSFMASLRKQVLTELQLQAEADATPDGSQTQAPRSEQLEAARRLLFEGHPRPHSSPHPNTRPCEHPHRTAASRRARLAAEGEQEKSRPQALLSSAMAAVAARRSPSASSYETRPAARFQSSRADGLAQQRPVPQQKTGDTWKQSRLRGSSSHTHAPSSSSFFLGSLQ